MSDMIEKVARVLAKDDHDFENCTDFYRKKAVQAIQTLSAPTDEMLKAGKENYSEGGCMGLADYERREVAEDIFTAMMGAALWSLDRDDENYKWNEERGGPFCVHCDAPKGRGHYPGCRIASPLCDEKDKSS